MYKKILLPTDASEYAERAAKHAIELGSMNGAEIIVLNVIEAQSITGIRERTIKSELRDKLEEEGRSAFRKVSQILDESEKLDECWKEVKLTLVIKEGSPSDIIIQMIDENDVDLVVMGTSGKHGLNRFLVGSVATKTMRSAPCPVLVVH